MLKGNQLCQNLPFTLSFRKQPGIPEDFVFEEFHLNLDLFSCHSEKVGSLARKTSVELLIFESTNKRYFEQKAILENKIEEMRSKVRRCQYLLFKIIFLLMIAGQKMQKNGEGCPQLSNQINQLMAETFDLQKQIHELEFQLKEIIKECLLADGQVFSQFQDEEFETDSVNSEPLNIY